MLNEGRLLVPELELSLGLWEGEYRGVERLWLRWLTLEGGLIPIPSEEVADAQQEAHAAKTRALLAEQQAAEARQQAAEARQQAERLAAKLRELGIDPDQPG